MINKISAIFILAFMALSFNTTANGAECIDTDGDGWGWDGEMSCRINSPPGECIDPDGDGWGWDGVKSCMIQSSDTYPDCIKSSYGWGWNGESSCKVPVAISNDIITRDYYDYVPAVIKEGNWRRIWWCGGDGDNMGQLDVIYYNSRNVVTGQWQYPNPKKVLWPSDSVRPIIITDDWDRHLTCDPSVVKGNFEYSGVRYTYAMYYSGTDEPFKNTGVGVAFSNNGVDWDKYPHAIIREVQFSNINTLADHEEIRMRGHYGRGQQVAIIGDVGNNGKNGNAFEPSKVWLWVLEVDEEKLRSGGGTVAQTLVRYRLTDGITLDSEFEHIVTNNGIRGGVRKEIAQPDLAIRVENNVEYLYLVTNQQTLGDSEPLGIDLYKIPLADHIKQNSQVKWEHIGSIEQPETGSKYNRYPAFLRNINGNLDAGAINVYFSPNDQGRANTTTDISVSTFRR